MNTQIEQFRKKLLNCIAQEKLPVGVTFLILKDILNDVALAYDQVLAQEQQKAKETEVKEEEE